MNGNIPSLLSFGPSISQNRPKLFRVSSLRKKNKNFSFLERRPTRVFNISSSCHRHNRFVFSVQRRHLREIGLIFKSCCGHRKQQKKSEKLKTFRAFASCHYHSRFPHTQNTVRGRMGDDRKKSVFQIEFHCLSEVVFNR